MGDPERFIEQVSLFLADGSQGRTARVLGKTGAPEARELTASGDLLHRTRLVTSSRRMIASIKITPIYVSVAARSTRTDARVQLYKPLDCLRRGVHDSGNCSSTSRNLNM